MPVTGHGPASRTVTRSTRPSSRKTWVMPSFLARIAGIRRSPGQPDLDVDAGGQVVEALQRVDRLGRRLVDVDQALVRANLEVLARVLVLERRADHAVDVLLRGQRDRTGHARAGARRRLDDLLRRGLDRGVVVRLQADANLVLGQSGHGSVLNVFLLVSLERATGQAACRPAPGTSGRIGYWNYLMTSVTTPEPTVRPPSRIAKRRPASMAIGWISSISIWTLSPGMTISVPSGRLATPVTSVVRK